MIKAYDKTNAEGFVKDRDSGLVINTNQAELMLIKEKRQRSSEIRTLQERIKNLEDKIQLIQEHLGIKV